MHDAIIIGAGIAGAACARELSRYDLDVLLLEAQSDVGYGATRANSGIVHAGYDPASGTLKARYNVEGARLYPQLAQDLDFPYWQNGSMVVAFDDGQRPALEALYERGISNGVEGLRIIEDPELHELEPNLNPEAVAALLVPTGAITNPYLACVAMAENAVANGVEVQLDTRVSGIERRLDGSFVVHAEHVPLFGSRGPRETRPLHEEGPETRPVGEKRDVAYPVEYETRIVINAAGTHAGKVNDMVSSRRFTINPRAGEYVLLDRGYGNAFTHTMFQVPTPAGKGVLVAPTTSGNLIVGPDAVERDELDDTSTTASGLDAVVASATRTWPGYAWRGVITNFAGVRASCFETSDFIIGEAPDAPGFFNVAAFDSPGLTSAPAVAFDLATRIATRLGTRPRADFVATRHAVPEFLHLDDEERAARCKDDPRWGHVVCRCEQVTEAEIVAAIHAPIPARTLDAIKWRTRAGMGRCQSGFCLPNVQRILARELDVDETQIQKGGHGSYVSVTKRGCIDALPHVDFGEGGAL